MSRALGITFFCGFVLLSGFATDRARAEAGTWQTDSAVGPNRVVLGIGISCSTDSFICGVVDGYSDSQTSTLSGSGALELDPIAGTLQFSSDGSADLGFGPQPTFHSLFGSDLAFAYVPFAGVPEFTDLDVFATAAGLISPTGLSSFAPGDYPFSATVPYAALADIVGDLEFNVPDLVIPSQNVVLSGTLRIQGDIDSDDAVEFQLLDLSAGFAFIQAAQIGGESVDISVDVLMTSNLSGDVEYGAPVPALGGWAPMLLAAALALPVMIRLRRA